MSERMTCPGCEAHTSSVLRAFSDDEPCPHCGLSAGAALEIMAVRATNATKAVKVKATEAMKEADRLRAENVKLRAIVERIRWALEEGV